MAAGDKLKKGLAISVNVILILVLSLILLGMFAELNDRRNYIPYSYDDSTVEMNLEDGDYARAVYEAFVNNPDIYSEGYTKEYEAAAVYADAMFKEMSFELAGDYVNAMKYDTIAADAANQMGRFEYLRADIDEKLKKLLEE